MIKLKYKIIEVDGLVVYYAKCKRNRSVRLSIGSDGIIKVTSPFFISEKYIIDFVRKKRNWIDKVLNKQKQLIHISRSVSSEEKYNLYLKLNEYIKKYEILMGINISKIYIQNLKSIWGSYKTSENSIKFNSNLYNMSDEFIEYIVVHEMAHVFVKNHSKLFYEVVSKYIPDWKERWKESKKICFN